MNTLEVRDLTVGFDTPDGVKEVVRHLDLDLQPGETHALLGGSGSGKSVTSAAILDLIDMPPGKIISGSIKYKGVDLLRLPSRERRRLYGDAISVVFQDPGLHLNPAYSVGRQISEVCIIHGVDRKEAQARALKLLERVGIRDPERRYHDFPHQFSGGQRQRIMIAMAMVMKPDLIIADEPTTALDVTIQAQILKLLKELQAETGMSVLLITHDLGVAEYMAESVSVLHNGEIVERGETQSVLKNPQHAYTKKLLSARSRIDRISQVNEGTELLSAQGVCIDYAGVRAVGDVNFTIREKEIVCVVGESGSGKSTLARAVLGLKEVSSGSIAYRGNDIANFGGSSKTPFRKGVQAVFQDPYGSLNPRFSIYKILSEPWTIQKTALSKSEKRKRAGELLESVGLSASDLDRYPSEFSGGQRQRIAIARALALDSELLICDEAVSALDMAIQHQIIDLLKDLNKSRGMGMFFITHDLGLVRNFADRVLVMKDGQIVEDGATDQVFDRPVHDYTRLLMRSSFET